MILTGKAKYDFESWVCRPDDPRYVQQMHIDLMYGKTKTELYAYYIEWFDSVGIYLTIGRYGYQLNTDCRSITKKTGETRQEATEAAIIKANELYNETH